MMPLLFFHFIIPFLKQQSDKYFVYAGIDFVQEKFLGQGPQDNESAVEQAKDGMIADAIRNGYKNATGNEFPIKEKNSSNSNSNNSKNKSRRERRRMMMSSLSSRNNQSNTPTRPTPTSNTRRGPLRRTSTTNSRRCLRRSSW